MTEKERGEEVTENFASGTRILAIEDDIPIQKLLKVSLEAHGYSVSFASTAADGLRQAASGHADLILLDLGLPDADGKEVVRRLREWSSIPIVILTARDREQEKIEVLDAGADDYVTKPFGVGELLARMRVALRHAAGESDEPVLRCGAITMDLASRQVRVKEKEVKLTPTEYDLLKVLLQHRGKVLTHRQIATAIWRSGSFADTHSIRVYVAQLRKKIEENPTQPKFLLTESGVGYRMVNP